MSLETWLALVALFFVGGLTPGPAVMLVMSSSFRYGFWPAMTAALGVASANVVWLALAASGAAVLATTFPQIFIGVKLISLAVILWLGINVMRGPTDFMQSAQTEIPPKGKLYGKGLVLQLTNPLAFATFLGILPAFFDTERAIAPQFLMMISTLTYLELQGLAVYAGFGRFIRNVLKDERMARRFNMTVGVIMIAAGFIAIFATL